MQTMQTTIGQLQLGQSVMNRLIGFHVWHSAKVLLTNVGRFQANMIRADR